MMITDQGNSRPEPSQPQQEQPPMASIQPQQDDESKWAMTGIPYPGKHDVMLGRGGESNYHNGNLTFRDFIREHKKRYQKARKHEKPIIALEVVLAWRDLDPPGRFLARTDPSRADSLWEDVGDDQACKRAGRTLGEKCSGKGPKPHQEEQEAEKVEPSQVPSADSPLSSAKLPTPKPDRRKKRPQCAMDFIAAYRSRQVASESKSHSASFPSASLTKKRKLTDNLLFATGSLSAKAKQPPPTTVTPDTFSKLMDEKVPVDIGTILDDPMRENAHSMREMIPTAEYLTRVAFLDL